MDPRLLRYYNQELQHLHEMGAEFARQFPKIAGRLGIDGIEVADPYVERLLEGAGFLAARVQLKLDAEFPRFTRRLLEILYPNMLAPTPSMLVARFHPQPDEPNLARGATIARGSALRGHPARPDGTACEFRTAHDVTLWPLELVAAEYFSHAPDLPPEARRARGGVRLRLRCGAGLAWRDLDLDRLRFYLSGSDEIAYKLHELIVGAGLGIGLGQALASAARPRSWHAWLGADHVVPVGYADEQALLPVTPRLFQGCRLLQEYAALPQRFLFFDLLGLAPALRRMDGAELELVLPFARGDPALEGVVDAANFALFCAPAVNLFPKRADRIHLADDGAALHVVPDRTRPMDYEVAEVSGVDGHGGDGEQQFLPLYAAYHAGPAGHTAYFSVEREPRLPSPSRDGPRSAYLGSEVFLSLVDPEEAPYRDELRQLSVRTVCTNRDLPLSMPLGAGPTDFTLDAAAPLAAIRCVKGPSPPRSPLAEGARAWRFISQLSLNHLSLLDTDARQGAAALRQILGLYAAGDAPALARQIDAVLSVRATPSVRRLPPPGPLCYGRGVRIELEVDELGFQGGSAFLFGSVLERFFARHASLNGFTETVLRASGRGEIMRWGPRCGHRPIL
ncbi:type VI secretion system baseplate subunit TssF [Pseudoduganella namucuonensis]|uniref:Type VI secretion system protein ImpG n=1 Tax=Pseudoduganella namucuonensis TaxID=1035707 RepID=A0A1I7KPQ1_9BURK|nr:type VI secretion system baseplate subunit TssF [Pseudoduganella namucuonensis]SFU99391.1 type VI secretion system protein ImpG [Pseudoduganella namucuonensis]